MKLAELTWPDVEALARDLVVLIPTGSLEQHGPHLPLFTDTLLVSHVADAIEAGLPESVLLVPPVWLGASAHHLAFAGSLSATIESYIASVTAIVDSLARHGFQKFCVINGHGGNTEPNGIALRELKLKYPERTFAHSGYFVFGEAVAAEALEGPIKGIKHACEAEASMMLAIRPDLVRIERLADDGLVPTPTVAGLVSLFHEITAKGSFGYASLATAEKGRRILDACIKGAISNVRALADGYVLTGISDATAPAKRSEATQEARP